MISSRAEKLNSKPSAIVEGHSACSVSPFSSENPEGYLNFGIAENRLIDDLALETMTKACSYSREHIHYAPLPGLLELREAFASFAGRFLNTSEVRAENVVVQCGLSSMCESLSFVLFDEGDELIVPAPYYSGFEFDFAGRFGVKLVPVPMGNGHHIEPIKAALTDKTKGLLLTHPHNPKGEVLSENFLRQAADFCEEKNLHLISDEIYALSILDGRPHHSVLEASTEYKKIHLLYGMAKDFGLAGLKTGFYYGRDSQVVAAMSSASYFHPVSTHTQVLVAELLEDEERVRFLTTESNRRVKKALDTLKSELPELTFEDPEAGMFFMADFTALLSRFENEKALFRFFLNELKINMTPGTEMGLEKEGYFRVCYARSNEEIVEFAKRLRPHLGALA